MSAAPGFGALSRPSAGKAGVSREPEIAAGASGEADADSGGADDGSCSADPGSGGADASSGAEDSSGGADAGSSDADAEAGADVEAVSDDGGKGLSGDAAGGSRLAIAAPLGATKRASGLILALESLVSRPSITRDNAERASASLSRIIRPPVVPPAKGTAEIARAAKEAPISARERQLLMCRILPPKDEASLLTTG
jgi:hypothetical protein